MEYRLEPALPIVKTLLSKGVAAFTWYLPAGTILLAIIKSNGTCMIRFELLVHSCDDARPDSTNETATTSHVAFFINRLRELIALSGNCRPACSRWVVGSAWASCASLAREFRNDNGGRVIFESRLGKGRVTP